MLATIVNPLPVALAHYERELTHCLEGRTTRVLSVPGIEGLRGIRRAQRGVGVVAGRLFRIPPSDALVVLWPAFGYFDASTWVPSARRMRVILIVHDVDPLRRQFGYSATARNAFRTAVRAGSLRVVCHTDSAARRLATHTGVRATVLPHPMLEPVAGPGPGEGNRPVVRVLGQYKSARDLEVLARLAQDGAAGGLDLEIQGRGWPPIEGWKVKPTFLDEASFADAVSTSSAIVIPYRGYSQSGVMVRAAEACTPAVGVDHEQIRFLYGKDWPGTVAVEGSWIAATHHAIAARGRVAERAAAAYEATLAAWRSFAEEVLPE